MKQIKSILLLVLMLTCLTAVASAEKYPEFTGNYYLCENDWCELKDHQINAMQLRVMLDRGHQTRSYGGFFNIPDSAPTMKTNKPRFLFYKGLENVDHRIYALVELAPMPYNNFGIYTMDGTDYQLTANYNATTTKQLWTFKREITLRFKPVEGKTGMFIMEPSEPLSDGFYVIDTGTPTNTGHAGLKTQEEFMGFYKVLHVLKVMPFIIGDRNKIALQAMSNQTGNNPSSVNTDKQPQDLQKAVNDAAVGLVKGIFGIK